MCKECKKLTGGLCEECLEKEKAYFFNEDGTPIKDIDDPNA